MINRTIIRLKIIQLMYSFYQNGGKNYETAEKELLFSLSKAYDLYKYLLLLPIAVTNYAADLISNKEQINKVAHKDEEISHRFIDNRFIAQLVENKQLRAFGEKLQKSWSDEPAYLKKLFDDIAASQAYIDYMAQPEVDYADDRELWRKLYKSIISKDERIDEILEEQSLYWNDDKEIIDTFVLKTIKKFEETTGPDQALLPEYKDEDDKAYAVELFRNSIQNDEYYRDLIGRSVKNWEFNRLAYMDVIIMQVAIAELINFPLIPISVTINEYVDIAKYYSTPKSAGYVNGIIDNVAKRLVDEGVILKPYEGKNKN